MNEEAREELALRKADVERWKAVMRAYRTRKCVCDHDYDDPRCVCQLEAIIDERRSLSTIGELIGYGSDSPHFKKLYWSDANIHALVDVVDALLEKLSEKEDDDDEH